MFDFPTPDITAPKRSRTMVPQQSLFLMNSPFVIAQAQALAGRLDWPAGASPPIASAEVTQSIVRLFRLIHARDPRSDELELARRFLAEHGAASTESADASDRAQAWAELAQTLLVSNEFLFVD